MIAVDDVDVDVDVDDKEYLLDRRGNLGLRLWSWCSYWV